MIGCNHIGNLMPGWLKKYLVVLSTDSNICSRKTRAKTPAKILYKFYQYLFFMPFLGFCTFLMGSLAYFAAICINPRFASTVFGTLWAKLNSYATPMFITVHGRENVDPNQSYVIVSNHQSHYDIFVLYGWIGIDFKWVMKASLRKVPFLGVACAQIGHIFIDRSNHDAAVASINNAKKKIVNGTSVLFFPEGTRSLTGKMNPLRKGAFRFARDMNLPLLPVTIRGTHSILPAKTLNLFPGKAEMIIHPPIPIEKYKDQKIEVMMEDVRQVIASGLPQGYGEETA